MNFKYPLPISIKKIINDSELKEINIGCSDSQVVRIKKDNRTLYLKIMKENQYKKLVWLSTKLPVPKIIDFVQEYGNDYLITEEMPGKMLCDEYYINNPDIAILILKDAFQNLFSVDISNCPFDVSNEYKLSLIENNVSKGLVNNLSLSSETSLEQYKIYYNICKIIVFQKN